jgi:small subunit ribosomal protein S6e
MPLKLNISNKEKAWKLEVPSETLEGKSVGDKIPGKLIKSELEGYELEITGGSDFAGFPMDGDVEGIGLKRILLKKGWGMWSKPKGLKKKKPRARGGLRLKKTVRGKTISEKVIQVNMKVLKEGSKKLSEVFPEQNQPKQKVKTGENKENSSNE